MRGFWMAWMFAATVTFAYADTNSTASSGYVWTQGEIETNKVDLLFVFDSSTHGWLDSSGCSNMHTFAEKTVLDMNRALARTELDRYFTFRIAGVTNVTHSFSGCDPTELVGTISRRSSSKAGGHVPALNKIRKFRDKVKADIVIVLSNGFGPKTFGGSYLLTGPLSPVSLNRTKESAFAFCDISSVVSRYTALHEVGHIMGAGHSNEDWVRTTPGPQLFPYSSGAHFTVGTNRYATVMSCTTGEAGSVPWTRFPVFSSASHTLKLPDVNTGKMIDTGVSLGVADKNDNTRTLRETYHFIANYRVAQKMDSVPIDPDSIRLSVVTGGVEMAASGTVSLRTLMSHDLRIKAESPSAATVRVSGLPKGLYYSLYTGRILGWPTKPGKYTVTVTANNNAGYKAAQSFKFEVTKVPRFKEKRGRGSMLLRAAKWRRPWWRRDGQCPYVVEKPLSVSLGPESEGAGLSSGDGLELKLISPDGAGLASGTIGGEKVSAYVQFERFGTGRGAGEGQERLGCLVAFPPRKGGAFAGYLRWVDLFVTVDEHWHIKTMKVVSINEL